MKPMTIRKNTGATIANSTAATPRRRDFFGDECRLMRNIGPRKRGEKSFKSTALIVVLSGYFTKTTGEYTALLLPVAVAGTTPFATTGATWIITFFCDIEPVSFTFMMRMPCHFTIV